MELFATAGRGTESFVMEEILMKCQAKQISKTDGKVHFTTVDCHHQNAIKHLLNLKSIERLFIKVYHNKSFIVKNKKALGYLHREVVSMNWIENVSRWRLFNPSKDCEDENSDSPPSKRAKQERISDNRSPVTFRVSCKISGKAKLLEPKDVSKCIGGALQKTHDWTVNLKKPTIEIFSQVNNDGIIIGIPVTEKPLSNRSYLKTFGLRSTVAWIMSYLADIKPGDIILDPMCGAGTILVEACHSWQNAAYIGIDHDLSQLEKSSKNISSSANTQHVHLIHAKVSSIPLPNGMVDALICDTPFGINHSSTQEVLDMYPSMLREMDRVLKKGGRIVLLTSFSLKDKLLQNITITSGSQTDYNLSTITESKNYASENRCEASDKQLSKNISEESVEKVPQLNKPQWHLQRSQYLKLGETDSYVLAFIK